MAEANESVTEILQTLDGTLVIMKKFLEDAITMRVEAAMLEYELLSMYRPSLLEELERLGVAEIAENSENSKPPELSSSSSLKK